MPEPTSACVLLFHPESNLVLVERHPMGFGLPGGKRERTDPSSLATAARELHEETGARLLSAASIITYQAGPHICEAFLALDFEDIPTRGARTAWVAAEALVVSGSRFPAYCSLMFARLAALRCSRGGWPEEIRSCR